MRVFTILIVLTLLLALGTFSLLYWYRDNVFVYNKFVERARGTYDDSSDNPTFDPNYDSEIPLSENATVSSVVGIVVGVERDVIEVVIRSEGESVERTFKILPDTVFIDFSQEYFGQQGVVVVPKVDWDDIEAGDEVILEIDGGSTQDLKGVYVQ